MVLTRFSSWIGLQTALPVAGRSQGGQGNDRRGGKAGTGKPSRQEWNLAFIGWSKINKVRSKLA